VVRSACYKRHYCTDIYISIKGHNGTSSWPPTGPYLSNAGIGRFSEISRCLAPQATRFADTFRGYSKTSGTGSIPPEEQQCRKRALIKGPKEFRDIREDLPKGKAKS
jgi:hypothetical protein